MARQQLVSDTMVPGYSPRGTRTLVPEHLGPLDEMVSGACLMYCGVVESKPLAKVIEISALGTSIRRFCAAHLRSGLSGLRGAAPRAHSVWVRADSSYRNGSDRLLEVLKWYRTRFCWGAREG